MAFKQFSAPAVEPVTLAEAKVHLRVEHADEDALITALIQGAREQAEHEVGRALITQTWDLVLDAFPAAEIRLSRPPIQDVVSVTYVDAAGVTQTMDSSAYVLDSDLEPGYLLPAYGTSWPATADVANAVRVRYRCGYGASGAAVPAGILNWMRIRIGNGYKLREQFVGGAGMAEVPSSYIDRLLDRYRTWE